MLESAAPAGFVSAAATDKGIVRHRNEDAFFASASSGIAVVSDGMGGAPAGAVASALATDAVSSHLIAGLERGWPGTGVVGVRDLVQESIEEAHLAIRQHGSRYPDAAGLGATLTAFVADRESGAFVVGHIGDSRAYLARGPVIRQLTRDDTVLQEHLDQGRLEADNHRGHPFGNVLRRVLGMNGEIQIQVLDGIMEPGDQILLCTDGITAVLTDREILEMLSRGRLWPVETVTKAFVDSANERGGPDNSTVVLLRRG